MLAAPCTMKLCVVLRVCHVSPFSALWPPVGVIRSCPRAARGRLVSDNVAVIGAMPVGGDLREPYGCDVVESASIVHHADAEPSPCGASAMPHVSKADTRLPECPLDGCGFVFTFHDPFPFPIPPRRDGAGPYPLAPVAESQGRAPERPLRNGYIAPIIGPLV